MLQVIYNNRIVAEVKSISAAWNKFRELRDREAQGSLDAVDVETKEIKLAVILKTNSKGKVEFRNRDKEENKKVTKKNTKKNTNEEDLSNLSIQAAEELNED
jgi:hypothetical protein